MLALCAKLCQLCFTELARKQETLQNCWESAPSVPQRPRALLCRWHRGAKRRGAEHRRAPLLLGVPHILALCERNTWERIPGQRWELARPLQPALLGCHFAPKSFIRKIPKWDPQQNICALPVLSS